MKTHPVIENWLTVLKHWPRRDLSPLTTSKTWLEARLRVLCRVMRARKSEQASKEGPEQVNLQTE
jgi:hypothetical protein